jgi:hypothetical protein
MTKRDTVRTLLNNARDVDAISAHWDGWALDIESGAAAPRTRGGLVTSEQARRSAKVEAARAGRLMGQAYALAMAVKL